MRGLPPVSGVRAERGLDVWRSLRRRVRPPVTIAGAPAGIVVELDVPVSAGDGAVLRVNVFRPAGAGRFPVLLSAHPYGKDRRPKPKRWGRGYRIPVQYRLMPQSAPFTHSALTSWEAPDPAFWVPRGYVVVNADLRGWGSSDGVGTLLSAQEASDCHDLVEWAGQQGWSNGRVGMSGVSYLAMTQWAAAATRPPHLAAISPWEGMTDFYRNFARQGGVLERGFLLIWDRGLRATGRSRPDLYRRAKAHALFDDSWQKLLPEVERIDVPVLACGSFSDHNVHTDGTFDGFRRVGSAQSWLYTHRGPKWATYYSGQALAVQAQFFDHFLAGRETGLLDVPRVRVEVRRDRDTISSIRGCSNWPPPGTRWRSLFLDAARGTLSELPPDRVATATFDTRRGRTSFTYRFDRDTEVIGPMTVDLAISICGVEDVSVFVGVRKFRAGREVVFEGSYGFVRDMVTHGFLLASHRGTDLDRSVPGRPFHPHTTYRPPPPGEVVTLSIGLPPSATLFEAGTELRLDVQGHWFFPVNPVTGQFPARYRPTPRGRATVHTSPTSASALNIPVAAPADR